MEHAPPDHGKVARALRLLASQSAASKRYYQAHRELINERSKAYWEANRDSINERRRARYDAAHPKKVPDDTVDGLH
jgi:hypothetical protein